MTVSIFSYRGMASLSVIGDAHLIPDPEAITSEFNREFQKLLESGAARAAKKAPAKKPLAKAPARKAAPRKAPARTLAA